MYSMSHFGVHAADLEKSLDFYVRALGGEKGRDIKMPSGSHLQFVNFAGFSVELIYREDDDRTPGRCHLAISVPDIRAAVRRANEAGYPVPESSITNLGTMSNCFLTGPDGESIELCQGSL